MGTLMQGLGFGGTAAGMARASVGWGQAATGLEVAGDLLSGVGTAQQYGYQAQVARNNSAIETANATNSSLAGDYTESAAKLKTGLEIGDQKAEAAAHGVDVNVGSPVAIRESTATVGAMDAAMIHYNAAREAYGHEVQAANDLTQSKLYSRAGKGALLGSAFKAGTSLLSGASSLQGKAQAFKLSGARG